MTNMIETIGGARIFGYAPVDDAGGAVALAQQRALVVAAGVAPEWVFEDSASHGCRCADGPCPAPWSPA